MSGFNLALKLAVGVACTVATGVVVSYGLQYLIADHNAVASKRALREQKRKAWESLKSIEADLEKTIQPRLNVVRQVLEGTDGSLASSPKAGPQQRPAVSRTSTSASISSPTKAASLPRASSRTPSPTSKAPRSSRSPSSASCETLSSSDVDRRLRDVDNLLLQVLEKLDSVRPADVADNATSTATSQHFSSASSWPILGLFTYSSGSDAAIDQEVARVANRVVEGVRSKKRALVKRAQQLLDDVDSLCSLAGIPSVGRQHASIQSI
ncbi:uncharacterized protein EV422DRAFT_515136 [Fimicolochytrium jonesii]|uniref:uncharacterized protein n=1 Tax=Fimicolochytrium jonesii TaxID=1396493 RepID=UPI0022FE396E|nr:uncharacterized protein EV422DRAFT_515136 [Fimicolochytrium jonesii]KAI8826055.1 hypothetical protein EV422DRAFT_515136 [Fimicolochytrium jonesii]